MALLALHIVLTITVGILLYRLVTVSRGTDVWTWRIVAAGFFLRASAGAAAFWTSYLELPVGRSLQLGDGLWFFALDASMYLRLASQYVSEGAASVIFIDQTIPSPVYVQLLAVGVAALGKVASVGILLNLFAYAGMSALVVRMTRPGSTARSVRNVVLAALAFSPSGILWSLQPLKDTFFAFLIVAWAWGALTWHRSWSEGEGSAAGRRKLTSAAVLLATTYAIAGVRWYFAVFALAATTLVFVALSFGRQWRFRLAAGLMVIVAMSQVIVLGAKPYLPPPVLGLLRPTAGFMGTETAGAMAQLVARSREGFDNTKGATAVRLGSALSSPKPAHVAAAVPAPATDPHSAVAPVSTSAQASTSGTPAPALPSAAPAPVPPPSESSAVPAGAEALTEGAEASAPSEATHVQKFLAGLIAVVVPRTVADALGLIEVGGGKGLWLFVELDTLVFDAVLLFAAWTLVKRIRRRDAGNEAMWQVAILTVLVAGALMYTISNFGTLFRHRGMIYTAMLMLPAIASFAHGASTARDEKPARLADVPAE